MSLTKATGVPCTPLVFADFSGTCKTGTPSTSLPMSLSSAEAGSGCCAKPDGGLDVDDEGVSCYFPFLCCFTLFLFVCFCSFFVSSTEPVFFACFACFFRQQWTSTVPSFFLLLLFSSILLLSSCPLCSDSILATLLSTPSLSIPKYLVVNNKQQHWSSRGAPPCATTRTRRRRMELEPP